MSGNDNLAVLPMFKDGEGGGNDSPTFQIMIDSADNGFVMTVMGSESDTHKVYLFSAKGADGPEGMVQDLIDQLGISDKVKLQK